MARQEGIDRPAVASLKIRPYTPDDYAVVRALFVEGMDGSYCPEATNEGLRNYVARSLLLDMADIEGTYFGSGGHFWIATLAAGEGADEAIGTVALQGKGDRRGELRRLSVRADFRRLGVARRLIAHAERWAEAHGFEKLLLTTGSEMGPAIDLYKALGYGIIKEVPSISNPGKTLISFEKTLRDHKREEHASNVSVYQQVAV